MTPTQLEAILAEREGILRMVNDTQIPTRRHAPGNTDVSWNDACRQIADDIRNRPTPASEEVGEARRIATEIERIATIAVSDSGQRISSHWLLSEARALLVTLARP